jgi:cellulose synthase/poly-beta-1,6-N-acetylglucosamine synthase-like glycosyltransferase
MAEAIFWSSVAFVLYAYLGYPLALLLLSRIRNHPVRKGSDVPFVSVIVAARNEEQRIRGKIENTLAQDYRSESLEVIVASDCSTDRTEAIVSEYSGRVRLVRSPERRGKEAAQHLAVLAARGDILVFTDTATALAPHGISRIVTNFADPSVGCVSSIDRYIDHDGSSSGEGAYVRYEMYLRSLETCVRSLVALSGSFFAARRTVCQRWVTDRQSDFNTLLNAVDAGYRGVLDRESVGYYRNIADSSKEFQRKVRTVVRGMAVLAPNLRFLNPWRFGLFAWELASHKVCRWLVPFAMIGALLSNLVLVPFSPLYQVTFALQASFYLAATAGIWTGWRVLRLPAFLTVANCAVLMAWLRFARGDRLVTWNPSERVPTLPQLGDR